MGPHDRGPVPSSARMLGFSRRFDGCDAALRTFASPGTLEFLKFGLVGLSGVGVNLGLYLVGTRLFVLSMHVASPLAIEASVLWNFFWNDTWTFRTREKQVAALSRLGRFHVVCLLGGTVNYLTLVLLVQLFRWWDVAAALAGIVAAVGVNFAGNSFWTWREKPER
jgi:dolichol-phosphate mannosyltransferase